MQTRPVSVILSVQVKPPVTRRDHYCSFINTDPITVQDLGRYQQAFCKDGNRTLLDGSKVKLLKLPAVSVPGRR